MVAVIYARYSTKSQKETSIIAQEQKCREYAALNGYTVLEPPYIDRALTGRSDDRPQFQRMIKDSRKKQFQRVLVYRFDRFSRNQFDTAIYKDLLSKNNVRVESATEKIPDNSSGVLLEGMINVVNEWYSIELSEKVQRNMDLNAEKCLSNGGTTPLGYKIVDKRYVLNEETAPIVQEVFTKYANGWSVKEICDSLK